MCVITERLKERFCKDLNLPIKLFCEPYFTERLYLYDSQFECVDKYRAFTELVERCGGEQQYFEMYNKVKDDAINYLNDNPSMQYFAKEEDFSKFQIKNTGFPKHDIYHRDNDGKCFISIDMRKGNFTALRHYDPKIVGNCEKYEDFLGLFTKESHLIYSKYIRQVIFGNVDPRRQVAYEQYLMDMVLSDVLEVFDKESIVYFSTDEIVIKIDETCVPKYMGIVGDIVRSNCKKGINVRADFFILHHIEGTDGYIREFLFNEKDIDIKGVNHLMMPFVLRQLNSEMYMDGDYVFLYEGVLAKLLTAPDISVKFSYLRNV